MIKHCYECDSTKNLSEFHKRGDKYQSLCKLCRKVKDADYYQLNKDRRVQNNKKWYKSYLDWYHSLKNGPCVDCGGEFHKAAMHWDHLPQYEKSANVSDLVRGQNKSMILEEIKKCELVCANCHAVRTYHRMVAQSG